MRSTHGHLTRQITLHLHVNKFQKGQSATNAETHTMLLSYLFFRQLRSSSVLSFLEEETSSRGPNEKKALGRAHPALWKFSALKLEKKCHNWFSNKTSAAKTLQHLSSWWTSRVQLDFLDGNDKPCLHHTKKKWMMLQLFEPQVLLAASLQHELGRVNATNARKWMIQCHNHIVR